MQYCNTETIHRIERKPSCETGSIAPAEIRTVLEAPLLQQEDYTSCVKVTSKTRSHIIPVEDVSLLPILPLTYMYNILPHWVITRQGTMGSTCIRLHGQDVHCELVSV